MYIYYKIYALNSINMLVNNKVYHNIMDSTTYAHYPQGGVDNLLGKC